jgi:hypothetical protein
MKRRKKQIALIACITIVVVAATGLIFTAQEQNETSEHQPKWLSFSELSDFAEMLQELGLTFTYADTIPDDTSSGAINISRLSEDIPVGITSGKDIDMLLAILTLSMEKQIWGLGWDVCVDGAIAEANLEDYWWEGIERVTRPERDRALIELATNHSFDELVDMGIFARPHIMEDFQALGFFLDKPKDFYTSLDDLSLGWVLD